MTKDAFLATLQQKEMPQNLQGVLAGIWLAINNRWEEAHHVAQQSEGTQAYDRLHACLHRMEGDLGNADYWYRRAGTKRPSFPVREELISLLEKNL